MMRKTKIILSGILLVLSLAGCSQEEQPIPPTETSTVVAVETSTATVPPTKPSLPGLVVLLTPPQGWGDDHTVVEQAAQARGFAFEVREGMTIEESPPNLQMIVSFGETLGLRELITGLPQVQFVVLGGSGLPGSPNLTTLNRTGSFPALAFTAGYIAAVQSKEYRIGIISVGDDAGRTYRDSFINGVLYFCGICNPLFPPFEPYPLYAEVPPGAGEAEIQQAADELTSRAVDMVHVAPALQSEALYQYLAQSGVRIVGSDAPPAGLEANWVASVIPSYQVGLQNVLDSALNGQGMGDIGVTLRVDFTGISEARLANFAEIISRLESGEIDPVGLVD